MINVGTPDSPAVRDVRGFLREFLSDPRVIDIKQPLRWMLVNLLILPTRQKRSAAAYRTIWSDQGSPLLVHGCALTQAANEKLEADGVTVMLAMRYGRPSIPDALKFFENQGIDRVSVMPLYPQYAAATTGTAITAVWQAAQRAWNPPCISVVPPFYNHPHFIEAMAQIAEPVLSSARAQRVMFSYHGLPIRHLERSANSGTCYRTQCEATTKALGDRLHIAEEERVTCFQSRMGRQRWIEPYTETVLTDLRKQGITRIVVLTPAFVADCIETLEEIDIREKRRWKESGGETFARVPCLNSDPRWVDAIVSIVKKGDG